MAIRSMFGRRRFLQGAAAFASTPLFLPGTVLGLGPRRPPSDRITLGFIGMGKMNRGHLNWFLRQDDVQVLAVCDVDTTRRESAKSIVDQKYDNSDCASYNDDSDLLKREDIDAVVIATPDHWHAHAIIEACKTGKDIYCEKPLTLTILEAKRCIDAVREHDRVFQTGSQQRSGQEFRKACELVRNGYIGEIEKVIVGVGGPSRWCDLDEEEMEEGLDWDRWLGPAPKRPYNEILSPRGVQDHFPAWRNYREYSGGGMTDWGAHHFDIAQWGLDMDESGPVEIHPPEDRSRRERGARFIYPNGVEVVHDDPGGVTFIGTEGEVFVNRGKLETKPESLKDEEIGEDKIKLYESPGHQRDWLDCIKDRRKPICDVEVGARSVTVCHLGNLVYWHGRSFKWDPKSWKFDNEADNKLLDYERRDGYELPSI